MYFDRKCKITFICHGATIYSEENRFSDKDNYPPLNENGVEEVEKICEYLRQRGVKNDKIYTSTAARCVQTAKYVSKVSDSMSSIPLNWYKYCSHSCC